MRYVVWKCFGCANAPTVNQTRKQKLLESEVDEIICTVKDYPKNLPHLENNLHKNFEFKLEKMNEKHELSFLYMAFFGDEQR